MPGRKSCGHHAGCPSKCVGVFGTSAGCRNRPRSPGDVMDQRAIDRGLVRASNKSVRFRFVLRDGRTELIIATEFGAWGAGTGKGAKGTPQRIIIFRLYSVRLMLGFVHDAPWLCCGAGVDGEYRMGNTGQIRTSPLLAGTPAWGFREPRDSVLQIYAAFWSQRADGPGVAAGRLVVKPEKMSRLVAQCRADSAYEKCRSATLALGAVTAWEDQVT
jgi:hypothetical protein